MITRADAPRRLRGDHGRLSRIRLALRHLVAASSWSLTSCVDLADRLCRGDETYVVEEA